MIVVEEPSREAFFNKYIKVLTNEQFVKLEDLALGLRESVTFYDYEIIDLDRRLNEINEFNYRLDTTAKNNNIGIELEKAGQVDEAVKFYEENIKIGYTATFSYDRLMILYRKQKRYDDEIRVIYRAIDVFTKENEKRFNSAVNNPNNAAIKDELQLGHETCSSVRGLNSMFTYVPYPVIDWSSRLTKVMGLKMRAEMRQKRLAFEKEKQYVKLIERKAAGVITEQEFLEERSKLFPDR